MECKNKSKSVVTQTIPRDGILRKRERIYIVDKDDERYCNIFIKGCSGEDYTGFFQTAGYIEQKTTTVCDSEQYCISKKQ